MPQKVLTKFLLATNRIGQISEQSPKSRAMSSRMNLAFASWRRQRRLMKVSRRHSSRSLGASFQTFSELSIYTDLGILRLVSLILKSILRARRLVLRLTVLFVLISPPTKQHQAVANGNETPSRIPSRQYILYSPRFGIDSVHSVLLIVTCSVTIHLCPAL